MQTCSREQNPETGDSNVLKSDRVNEIVSCTRRSVLYLFELFVFVGICIRVNAREV